MGVSSTSSETQKAPRLLGSVTIPPPPHLHGRASPWDEWLPPGHETWWVWKTSVRKEAHSPPGLSSPASLDVNTAERFCVANRLSEGRLLHQRPVCLQSPRGKRPFGK